MSVAETGQERELVTVSIWFADRSLPIRKTVALESVDALRESIAKIGGEVVVATETVVDRSRRSVVGPTSWSRYGNGFSGAVHVSGYLRDGRRKS